MASDYEHREVILKTLKGKGLLRNGDYEAALATLTEAISRDPDRRYAYLNRSQSYRYLGRHEEADNDYLHFWSFESPSSRWDSWVGKMRCRLGNHGGHWQYKFPNQCAQTKICHRCQARLERTDGHIASSQWGYLREDKCHQAEKCRRCNLPYKLHNIRTVHNRAAYWKTCSRCDDPGDLPAWW